MNHAVLEPIGAVVSDVSLRDLTPGDVQRLRELLADHGVLIFPGRPLGDQEFVGFLRSFGELAFTAGETHVAGQPDLNVVSNVGRATPPRSVFHVDTSYVSQPPAYTALRAVAIPEQGGATLFTNQYRAYDTLDGDLRSELADARITHVVTGVEPGPGAETSARHPVFRPHPLSGRIALYLSAPARCQAISGFSDARARQIVELLFEHSTREDNVLSHAWSPGDVVMWDNACVLHRADHSRVVGDRVMHRGMVARHRPALAV